MSNFVPILGHFGDKFFSREIWFCQNALIQKQSRKFIADQSTDKIIDGRTDKRVGPLLT